MLFREHEPEVCQRLQACIVMRRKQQGLACRLERTQKIHEPVLRALIQRESARRLALLGGSEPQLNDIPRRQPESAA